MPRLADAAKHVVTPDGMVATGWPRVRDTCRNIGVGFDDWQDDAGRLILAKAKDGLYAARDGVVMSIPRQVGKTYLIGWIIYALCLIFPGLTVIWTAHRVKTAKETFGAMEAMSRQPNVAPHILRSYRARGDESVEFKNGSRILFGAREAGFGRGFAGVDILVFDEAQILTEAALEDMLAAQNVAPNPLTCYIGTPPRPKDPGEVFTRFRTDALDGTAGSTLYIEFSADAGADRMDREQWRKANPSFPKRTPERAILRLLKRLSPESAAHEVLGIWDENAHKPVVSRPAWDALQAHGVLDDRPADALAIDRDPTGPLVCAGCWVDGGEAHVELLPLPLDEAEAARVLAAASGGRRGVPVFVHSTSPAKSVVPALQQARVDVRVTGGPDMAVACDLLVGELAAGRVTHRGQKPLTDSIMVARTKPYGHAGQRIWDFGAAGLAPTVAVTLARYGVSTIKHRTFEAMF